jgi:hypothetical protein
MGGSAVATITAINSSRVSVSAAPVVTVGVRLLGTGRGNAEVRTVSREPLTRAASSKVQIQDSIDHRDDAHHDKCIN